MSENDARRKEITALVGDIEYLQAACGIEADPGDQEAREIVERIERRLSSIDFYRKPAPQEPAA